MTEAARRALNSAYQLGQSYRVPCIKTRTIFSNGRNVEYWGGEWIPVLGQPHRDTEIINFPFLHWHVDWRFVSEAVYKRVAGARMDRFVLAQPLMVFPAKAERKEDTTDSIVESQFTRFRTLKCKRELQKWNTHHGRESVSWMAPLEKACAGMKMKGMICPHRGTPLNGCPQDGDVVHCPSHGLRWNVKTGELVTA